MPANKELKMRRSQTLQVLFVLLIAVCVTSWAEASSLKDQIIGKKWMSLTDKEQLEFFKEGTVVIVKGDRSITGNYRFIDDKRLRVDVQSFGGASMVFEVSFNQKAGELSFREPTGKVTVYVTQADFSRRSSAAQKSASEAEKRRIEVERKRLSAEQKRIEAKQKAEEELAVKLMELDEIIGGQESTEAKIIKIGKLIARGLDLNAAPPRHMVAPFWMAAQTEDVKLMEFMISRGMQVNDRCNASTLKDHVLTSRGREMVDMLLGKGLDVSCLQQHGSPFVFAVKHSIAFPNWKVLEAISALELMQKWNIDIDARNFQGRNLIADLNSETQEIRMRAEPLIRYLQAGSQEARKAVANELRHAAEEERQEQKDLAGLTAVAAGGFQNVAVKKDGTVWTWGSARSASEMPINGDTMHRPVAAQVDLFDAIDVAAGSRHAMALRNDGTVWTWGYNDKGQLGDGTMSNSSAPVQVKGLSDVRAITAGAVHSIALRKDGSVWAWGSNDAGELGDGTTTGSLVPVKVLGVADIIAVEAGISNSFVIRKDGRVFAWGSNYIGMLGDGTDINRPAPVEVKGLSDVIALAVGNLSAMALRKDGTVWAWGDYELGKTTWRMPSSSPVQVKGISDVVAIAAGSSHNIVVKKDGSVWAWGDNNHGQLGDGTTKNGPGPVKVEAVAEVSAVAAGLSHTVALKRDGTVAAWGNNSWGQLGDGTMTNSPVPLAVRRVGDKHVSEPGAVYVAVADLIAPVKQLRGSLKAVFSPDGKMIAIDDGRRRTDVRDASTGELITSLEGRGRALAFSPDGKLLAAWDGKTVSLWDVETWTRVKSNSIGSRNKIWDLSHLAFSPDGRLFAAAETTSTTVWDLKTWETLRTIENASDAYSHTTGSTFVFFMPDGNRLAISGVNRSIVIWDLMTGGELKRLEGLSYLWVALSPDGKTLASSTLGSGEVVLRDVASGNILRTLGGSFMGLAFSPDGKVFATGGSGKGQLILWEAATGRKIKTIDGPSGHITALAFSPDGRRLASVDTNENMVLWDTSALYMVSSSLAREALQIEGERDRRLRELFKPQNEFETMKEYEERIVAGKAEEVVIRKECADSVSAAVAAAEEETKNRRSRFYPAILDIKLLKFDADRGGFEANLKGSNVFINVAREKAIELSKRKDSVAVHGFVKYVSAERAELANAFLLDEETQEKFPFGRYFNFDTGQLH